MRPALFIMLLSALALWPAGAEAIDLDRVNISHLENGLTLLVVEERAFPVVSVQMAYKTGGRDDPDGRMGLAHFFEHMAFRSSKNFPDTALVSDIYAAGGEWHGYTWIDHITFFATAPKTELDLLLRIEADRLGRLDLAEKDVEAETGAVIAEMNGYANDPSTLLFDAVLAAAFEVHPYRKNTIGYGGDINAITHADIMRFYRERIRPGTAVLAIVGDVDATDVERRVRKLFGRFKGAAAPVLPPASEPSIPGERHVRLEGDVEQKLFRIAYSAPAANSSDFPAFLVLQALAGASAGVNFLQNDWGTPVREGAALYGVAADLTSWVIPTAEQYVFLVSGTAGAKTSEIQTAAAVQTALDALSRTPIGEARLSAARDAVIRELQFDVETTEDAAHQLAYFEAIGALDALLSLDDAVARVTAEDIARVAQTYLDKRRRTIGWFVPAADKTPAPLPANAPTLAASPERIGSSSARKLSSAAPPPAFSADAHIAVQQSPLSPTIALKAVLSGLYDCALCAQNDPEPGYTSVLTKGLSTELDRLVAEAAANIDGAIPAAAGSDSSDPSTRLQQLFAARFQTGSAKTKAAPSFIAVAGDIDAGAAMDAITAAFDTSAAAAPVVRLIAPSGDMTVSIPEDKAQAALGLMVETTSNSVEDAVAWRLALYMFAHDYEGRFGKEAISRRGLAYYIETDFARAGNEGLITLSIGVDPEKQAALRALLEAELKRFVDEPPDSGELAEAKRHFIGRRISAAQSNEEHTSALAINWANRDRMDIEQYSAAVNAVPLEKVHAVLNAFADGAIITVTTGAGESPKR